MRILIALLVAALLLTGCTTPNGGGMIGTVNVNGQNVDVPFSGSTCPGSIPYQVGTKIDATGAVVAVTVNLTVTNCRPG